MIDPKKLDEIARKLGIRKYAVNSPAKDNASDPKENNSGLNITEKDDKYILEGISYKDSLYHVEWFKDLLDNGKSHTQQDWITMQKNHEFGEKTIPDAPLYNATMLGLYSAKSFGIAKKVKTMFNFFFNDYYLTTSSKIIYSPLCLDKIVHSIGTDSEYEVEVDIAGESMFVNGKSQCEEAVKAIFGTDDLDGIKKVYKWLSGYEPYLLRLKNKPSKIIELCVVLGICNGVRFSLYVNDYSSNRGPALGVVVENVFLRRNKGNAK